MTKAKQNTSELKPSNLVTRLLGLVIGAIFVIAPLYAPITVNLASHFQHFDFFRIWKELALSGLALVLVWFMITHRSKLKNIAKDKLLVVMIVYSGILLAISLYDLVSHRVSSSAVIYGMIIDLRLIGFFAVVYLAFRFSDLSRTFNWKKAILLPAALVISFGLLQATVLPNDILSHIGYSKATIVPYQTVDNQPDFVRVQSTLRGPNPLGAYLVVISCLILSIALSAARKQRGYWMIFGLTCIYVLFVTYSRSAMVGLIIALGILIAVYERRYLTRKIMVALLCLGLVFAGAFLSVRNNYQVQNIFFHSSDSSGSSVSSNAARVSAISGGLKDISSHPLGGGVGSAGPASLRNIKSSPKIAESYFIQIGQEVGIIGLISFVTVNILLIIRLYKQKDDPLARALLASLIGLIFVNLVSHAWADDTLAYVWWGLAGIALSQTNYMTQPHSSIKK